jgi:hypothetical protein
LPDYVPVIPTPGPVFLPVQISDALAAVAPPVLYWASKRSNTYAIRACLQFATRSLEDAAFMPLAIEAAGVAEAWATRVRIPPREVDGARPTATIVGAS